MPLNCKISKTYLNCDFLMYTGTRGPGAPGSGLLSASHVVATPLLTLPVGVVYFTTTAVTWTVSGYS